MNNQELLNDDLEYLCKNDEYMKKFKKLSKDQQLAELSRVIDEINSGFAGKVVLCET